MMSPVRCLALAAAMAWPLAPLAADFLQLPSAQLGPRPFYLVNAMEGSRLKTELANCARQTSRYRPSVFSIGHRGAPLQFPEHTLESYVAAAQMGAGILECDVTFTKDHDLVCRHSQCDLHTTTDILLREDLAAKCSVPFSPAEFGADGELVKPAAARCCTTDITTEEFLSLRGKMDAFDSRATSAAEYVGGTANWRTDLYSTVGLGDATASSGTLLTHAQSIELFKALRVGMTPELKSGAVDTDGDGVIDLTQSDFALKLIDEYVAAGVGPRDVWPQSFVYDDVLTWVRERPRYGKRAVFLDGRYGDVDPADPGAEALIPSMETVVADGVNVIAPPLWMLVKTGQDGQIAPSRYAKAARRAGLDIIAWTTERSGRIDEEVVANADFYYLSTLPALTGDGDILRTIDVLAQDVGVIGIFSDWPATTTFYANCKAVPEPDRRNWWQ